MKRKIYQSLAAILAVLLISSDAMSQDLQIKGRVVDKENNQPLEAATISVVGSRQSTRTNASGEFSIALSKAGKITVTFVGYGSQTVDVTGSNVTPLIYLVREQSTQLSDVVVTGLGVRRETKKLGYAVQEVKGEDLVKAREPNPVNSLVGKISGLDVAINKELLAAPNVSLRGYNISLYVVDGIPITSDTWNISPDDIETYTVLKGLAATAIYGSRAQNGAILITTKRAKKNKKGYTIEYNSSTQLDKGFIALPKTQALYGGGDYSQYEFGDGKGGGINDGDYDVWGPALNGQLIPQWNSPVSYTHLTLPTKA